MSDKSIETDPVGELAESFIARYRRGERPSLTEYCTMHPELAGRIRALFPALVIIEELASGVGNSLDNSVAPRGGLPRSAHGERLERIGDYRVLREIGRGGMGVVYEAEQLSLGRRVALKVLAIRAAKDAKALERFRREARAAARLHHTNIVPVFEVGQDNDVCFYAMQFIQGQGLDQVLLELQRMRRSKDGCDAESRLDASSRDLAADANSAASVAEAMLTGRIHIPSAVAIDHPQSAPCAEQVHPSLHGVPRKASTESLPTDSPAQQPPGSGTAFPAGSSTILTAQANLSSVSESNPHYFHRSVAGIGVGVADALAYAHGRGVLHRDIKPSNLLLDADGIVWVTDFGLAKTQGDDLTHTGDLVGTLRYMAPERFQGRSDPRSDVYGLGVTLYELLTLVPAFDSPDRLRAIQQVTKTEPTSPRNIDPRIPRDLETIVLKAIEKEPHRRYASAAAMAEDLRRFLNDRPIDARRSAIWERVWRVCRRNPLVSGLAATVIVLASVLAVGALLTRFVQGERDRAVANLHRAIEAEEHAHENMLRAEQAERAMTIHSHITQAAAYRRRGGVGQRVNSLRELEQALLLDPSGDLRDELRNEFIATLALADLQPVKVWDWPLESKSFAFDGKLQTYASGSTSGVISVRRVDDDSELARFTRPPCPDPRLRVKFSPNGRFLAAFAYDGLLTIWDVDRKQVVLTDNECAWEYGYDFSADSTRLAVGRAGEVVVYDLARANIEQRWHPSFVPWCIVFDPSGERLALCSYDSPTGNRVELRTLAGDIRGELRLPNWAFQAAWAPDGKSLAVGCNDGTIKLWDLSDCEPTFILLSGSRAGIQVAFNPNGDLLAAIGWSGVLEIWDPRTGHLVFQASMPPTGTLQFGEDGRTLAGFQDGTKLSFQKVILSDTYRYLARDQMSRRSGEGSISSGIFFDSRLIALSTSGGLGFWDVRTGRQIAFEPGLGHPLEIDSLSRLYLAGKPAQRLTIRNDRSRPGRWHIGNRESLPDVDGLPLCCASRDGSVLAWASGDGGYCLRADEPSRMLQLGPHQDARYIALDPDGHLAATGSYWGTMVKVWDARTGALITTLPAGPCRPEFSPDGRWLVTGGDGLHFWKVGSWTLGMSIADGLYFRFASDSKTLAVATGHGAVRLLDVDSGYEYGRLDDPNNYRVTPLFNRDDTLLVTTAHDGPTSQVWDLQQIGEELSSRGIDWNLPHAARGHESLGPVAIELVWDESKAAEPSAEENVRAQIVQYRRAYEAHHDDPVACNNLAWILLTAPEPLRSTDEALPLAEQAVRMAPAFADQPNYRNTLGVAYYRAGRYREALKYLEPNLTSQADQALGHDLYFLAMSYQQLGDSDRALQILTLANRWVAVQRELPQSYAEELVAFRAEAEELIGN